MKRPVVVTVFGILNIVFAGLGVFGMLASIFLLFAKPIAAAPNPALKAMEDSPTYAAWIKVSIPLAALSCAALLAAGIGLLAVKEWGRKLSIGWAIYSILMGIVNLGISYAVLIKPLLADAARQKGPEAAIAMGGAVGGVVGGCFGFVYPILLIIFMTRPNVKCAFGPPLEPTELDAW